MNVTGIVTGTSRKGPLGKYSREELDKMLSEHYKSVIHIDRESLLRTYPGSREYEEYTLSGREDSWSREVIALVREMKPHA